MVTVLLATHLSAFVDSAERSVRSVEAKAGLWPEFVRDVQLRYPRLASRVFSADDELAPGFALVLNDEVVHGKLAHLSLKSRDELCILVTIAGGSS